GRCQLALNDFYRLSTRFTRGRVCLGSHAQRKRVLQKTWRLPPFQQRAAREQLAQPENAALKFGRGTSNKHCRVDAAGVEEEALHGESRCHFQCVNCMSDPAERKRGPSKGE